MRIKHTVQMDTMFIHRKPVPHMVVVATNLKATTFLKYQSSKDICKSVLDYWIYLHVGTPEVIHVDQGSAYISTEMKVNIQIYGVKIWEETIETPESIGTMVIH